MKLLPNYILQRIDLDGSYAEKLQYGSLSFLTYPKKKKEEREKKKKSLFRLVTKAITKLSFLF